MTYAADFQPDFSGLNEYWNEINVGQKCQCVQVVTLFAEQLQFFKASDYWP